MYAELHGGDFRHEFFTELRREAPYIRSEPDLAPNDGNRRDIVPRAERAEEDPVVVEATDRSRAALAAAKLGRIEGVEETVQTPSSGSGAVRTGLSVVLAACVVALFFRNTLELAFVGDDAFIAFRYARNWVDGLGLVWNPGEYVEGFSSLSWVGLIAAGMGLGLDPERLANAVGLLCGLGVLIALGVHSRRAFGAISPLSMLAPLLLVLNRSFVGWSTGGLETQLFSLLVLLAFLAFLREREREEEGERVLSPYLFFAATLTRPEGPLFFGIAAVFGLIDVARKKRSLASLVRSSLPYLVLFVLLVAWRHAYFGYWLPNTFYAKVPGFWFEQGFKYLEVFASEYRIAWIATPVLGLLLVRRRVEHWLLATAIVAYTAYVAAIGGDRFEFRFMVVVLPLLYWLYACAVFEVGRSAMLRRLHAAAPSTAAVVLALAAVYPGHLIAPSRVHAEVVPIGLEAIEHTARFAASQRERALQLLQLVEQGLLPDDVRIGARAAGVVPYFTRFYTVDMWGLNDAYVAHEVEPSEAVPAHRKAAPAAYLREKRLDMIEAEDGFIRPLQGLNLARYCRAEVRCVKAGPYVLLFETTLGPAAFAERFARFETVH